MKKSIFLFFAAILCATSAWAANVGFESSGNTMKYYSNLKTSDQTVNLDRTNGTTTSLGAVTALYLKGFACKMYQDADNTIWGGSAQHAYYKIHRTAVAAGTSGYTDVTNWDWNWQNWNSGWRYPTGSKSLDVNLLSGLGSGKYSMTYYFQQKGSSTWRLPSTSSKYNVLTWTVNVPDITSAECTSNGTGLGTEASPFMVPEGDILTLTIKGTQKSNDANSELYAQFASNAYSSTLTHNITPTTTLQSITIKVKYYNSTDELSSNEKTLTIYYKAIQEETNEVTISYQCNGNKIDNVDDEIVKVGVSTPSEITARAITGYKFSSWTHGAGVQSADATANPISITTKAGETDYTLTANYEKLEVVYFVNNKTWSAVNAYAWDANENKNGNWPGVAIEKTGEKIGDYDVYYYCIDREVLDVEKIIFNNGNGGEENQTKNYAWVDGKYYWHGQADDFEGGTKEEAVKYFTIPVVAGSSATLFQTTWDITNTANEMGIQADGTYTLVKSGVTLAVETIEYKVVIGHYNWEKAYGDNGNNATLEIETSGKYNVTFTYNPTGNVVSATAELLNEEVVVPTVAMHGNFLGSWEDTENFTIADNKETAELEMLIEKGNYEFGMRINGSGNWTANGSAFTSTDNENVITENGDKMTFAANKDGYYTFTWTYETNTLTITYPTTEVKIERTFTVAGDNRTAFGETWAPANTANDMILQADGTYKWTKTQIALKKDTEISFKVVKNHDWNNGSWPGEAWVINTIDEDGYYTIDITFDLFTKNITVTATWTGEAPFKDFSNQPATLYFHPSSNWLADEAEFAVYLYNEGFGADAEPIWKDMTDSDGDGIYEVANAKEHEYVMFCRMNPSRTENNWDNTNMWNQISTGLTIPNTTGDLNTCCAVLENLMGNIATEKCTWVVPTPLTDANWATIVNTYKDQKINLVVERTFVSGQNHTLCLPFNLPTNSLGENSKAYQLSSIVSNSANELELKVTEHNTMLAGQPYIVNATKGNNNYDHLIVSNVTVTNATAGTNVVTGGGFKATLQAVTATNGTTDGSTEYYIGATSGNLHKEVTDKLGLRALIVLTNTDGTAVQGVRARVAFGENVETGIDNIITTDAPIKVIQNGQLIIIREGVKYNVQGQKL